MCGVYNVVKLRNRAHNWRRRHSGVYLAIRIADITLLPNIAQTKGRREEGRAERGWRGGEYNEDNG